MNGDYLSYFPHFESNQVLTSAHLNELRQYLDEQIRLTRAQLNGIGIACGLTFELAEDGSSLKVYEGFGVSSEGFFLCIKGELPPENPAHASPGGYSIYTKCRVYTDPSPDLYWSFGPAASPSQLPILELLTDIDAQQLIIEGVDSGLIHDIEPSNFTDKVLVLYLEQSLIALKTCAGKDCDNKGSKSYMVPKLLLLDRGAKAGINGTQNPAEIVVTALDGMLIRQPYPKPIRVPRLVAGLSALPSPLSLQDILYKEEISEGYEIAIDYINEKLADAIDAAYLAYGPFLGLTERKIADIDKLRSLNLPAANPQYLHDLLKDIARGLNEFLLLAYELKRDCCNDTYNFPRHLMLGTAIHDTTFNQGYHDKYRNYYVNFAMTWAQDQRMREAQLMFRRILTQINAFVSPPNLLAGDASARIVPSKEDLNSVGEGSIPDYYSNAQLNELRFVWDPSRTMKGLDDEVLTFQPIPPTSKDYILQPLKFDIDDFPFLRIQNMLGLDVNLAEAALRKSMKKANLAFEVVSVVLNKQIDKDNIGSLLKGDCCYGALEVQYQGLRVHIHSLVAKLQAVCRKIPFNDLEKGIAMAVDLRTRFINQTPVALNVLEALRAASLFEFVKEDGLPNMIKGLIPAEANDSPASLFKYMYGECRTMAQYLELLLKYWAAISQRGKKEPCDFTKQANELAQIQEYLRDIEAFLADDQWAVLIELISQAKRYLFTLSTESPKLFHKFAEAHPGIEHLGGTYKGGTYVLVYERTPIIRKTDEILPDKTAKGNDGLAVDDGKVFFKSDFNLDEIFEDVESDEFVMDAAFSEKLERPEIKAFLLEILTTLSGLSFTRTELKRLDQATVESLFADYLSILAARAGRLVPAQVDAITADYFKAINTAIDKGLKIDVSEEELLDYMAFIDNPSSVERTLPSAEEARAVAELVVAILSKNDKYLDPGQVDTLIGLSPQDVWPAYLALIEGKLGIRLSIAAVNELKSEFIKLLKEVGARTLLSYDIRLDTWEAYITSIKTGTVFEIEDDSEVLEPLLAFLVAQVQKFGHLILSKDDIKSLEDSTVPTFWDTYLGIYAAAIGDQVLDADLQRNLAAGFYDQLSNVDEVQRVKAQVEESLPPYLDKLKTFILLIAAEAFPDNEDIAVLMDLLVDILERSASETVPDHIGNVDFEDFRSKEPEELWPLFVLKIKESSRITVEEIEAVRANFVNRLLSLSGSGNLMDAELSKQLNRYIRYVSASGPSDNPYFREAIVKVLDAIGSNLTTPRYLERISNMAASVIWPTFVRDYLRFEGKAYDSAAVATLQHSYVDLLKAYDVKELEELGIAKIWEVYIESLEVAQVDSQDLGGLLVGFIIDILKTIEASGPRVRRVGSVDYDAFLSLFPAEILPVWLDELVALGLLLEEDRESFEKDAINTIIKTEIPGFAPPEFVALWQAYLDSIRGKSSLTSFRETVVADFSLPYRIADLSGIPSNIKMPDFLPPIIAGGDIGFVKPGAAIDIRILENDDQASGNFAEGRRDLKVEIVRVIQPAGGLGGVADLISDPESTLADPPRNILRYEAFYGTPISNAEIVEIVYRISEESTGTSATGTVLIFVGPDLGLMSDPCCCCKDYSFVVKKEEKISISDIYTDFEEFAPIVLKLVTPEGALVSTFESDNFLGHVTSKAIEFTSKGKFEGTVSFEYDVTYGKGTANCRGRITMHVICPCIELPCEVTVNLQPGETILVEDLLTKEQVLGGIQVRLNQAGNPVTELSKPDPLLTKVTVPSGANISTAFTTIEITAGAASGGPISIPFFKGIMVDKTFDIQGECTLIVNLVNTACTSEATVTAGEAMFVTSALTNAEVLSGMVLRFERLSAPSMTISPIPIGLDTLLLTRGEQGFNVLANDKGVGDISFSYFKGRIVNGVFVPETRCTMTLHVQPSSACIVEYSLLENQTLVINDLLTAEELSDKAFLLFDVNNFPTDKLATNPIGAASLNLVMDAGIGLPNTAFVMQPDFAYNGIIEWPYFVVTGSISTPKIVRACTVRVSVAAAPDCNKQYNVASGVKLSISETLMRGEEVRFYNGLGFELVPPFITIGTQILELEYSFDGLTPIGVLFQSTKGFSGPIVFRIAVGRVVNGIFRASRICTITINVDGAPKTFAHNVTAELGLARIYTNIIDSIDLGLGATHLRFLDGAGTPTTTPPFDFSEGDLAITSGGPASSNSDAVSFVPNGTFLGTVSVPMAKGKMTLSGFESIVTGVLNITIVPNTDCNRPYQNVSGASTLINDLITVLERDVNGFEVRFFENNAVSLSPSALPNGLAKLELANGQNGKPINIGLQSQSNFEGLAQFKIAVVSVGKIPSIIRVCTIEVTITKGALNIGFELTRNAPNNQGIDYTDILTALDKETGTNELRFIDNKGGYSFSAEPMIGVQVFEIASTASGANMVRFLADGSISGAITVELAKGKLDRGVFLETSRGTLTIVVAPSGGKEGSNTLTSFTYDKGFTTSKYYDPKSPLQEKAINVLDTMEPILNDSVQLENIGAGKFSNTLRDLYAPMFTNLKDAIMVEKDFNVRAYYLRLFALELDVAIELAIRVGDVIDGTGIDLIFQGALQILQEFRLAEYYDPAKSTDRITTVLTNRVVPSKAEKLSDIVLQMLSL